MILSPATLKYLSTEEVKACTKFPKTKTSSLCTRTWICNHGSSTYIKRILIMPQTTFLEIAVYIN